MSRKHGMIREVCWFAFTMMQLSRYHENDVKRKETW